MLLICHFVMICLCTLASCLDLKSRHMPLQLLLSLLLGAAAEGILLAVTGTGPQGAAIMKIILQQLLGAFFFSLPLWAASLVVPQKIGGGDLKMSILLGLYLTENRVGRALPGMLAACLIALFVFRSDMDKRCKPIDRQLDGFPFAVCLTAGFIAGLCPLLI